MVAVFRRQSSPRCFVASLRSAFFLLLFADRNRDQAERDELERQLGRATAAPRCDTEAMNGSAEFGANPAAREPLEVVPRPRDATWVTFGAARTLSVGTYP